MEQSNQGAFYHAPIIAYPQYNNSINHENNGYLQEDGQSLGQYS